jgi:LysM repeat protein
MSRVAPWNLAACTFACILSFSSVGWTEGNGAGKPPSFNQDQTSFLEYRLRAGESLGEVAHLFRIPVGELAQVNQITDPTRLQAGQLLKVPNVFAQQTAQLQQERGQLLTEKARLEKQLSEQQKTLTATKADLQKREAEQTALVQTLSTTRQWQRGAWSLAVLLLGVLAWTFLLRADRKDLQRKLSLLTQENEALQVAKEKYRQAAAQLELRYQKLYSAREKVPEKFVSDGATLISRFFVDGSAQLEQLLASIQAERAQIEQLADKEQKVWDSFLHPFRGFRHRLKYHGA